VGNKKKQHKPSGLTTGKVDFKIDQIECTLYCEEGAFFVHFCDEDSGSAVSFENCTEDMLDLLEEFIKLAKIMFNKRRV